MSPTTWGTRIGRQLLASRTVAAQQAPTNLVCSGQRRVGERQRRADALAHCAKGCSAARLHLPQDVLPSLLLARLHPPIPMMDEPNVASVYERTKRQPENKNRVPSVNRVAQQSQATHQAQIPECVGDHTLSSTLGSYPLHNKACREHRLTEKPDRYPHFGNHCFSLFPLCLGCRPLTPAPTPIPRDRGSAYRGS